MIYLAKCVKRRENSGSNKIH